jgi:hypothetical protein
MKIKDISDDRLTNMFELQRSLQEEIAVDPTELTGEALRVDYIKNMIIAAIAELMEALDETSWKPWTAGSAYVNEEAAFGEMRDAWQFMMNAMMAIHQKPDVGAHLYVKHAEKVVTNYRRHAEGYDGKTGKCPGCKRALDDEGVKCTGDACAVYVDPEDRLS